ncbi:hypothetical protein L6452_35116 [Arctium lappa]|uniref:Uncharacterized protein n=1 Tax=Arctium lappa TaxID=4217 RepID=A0ACB8YPB1_ARCLA|nr:hypothetical protein L6452_35116 [Arctium lappa]
MEKEVQRQRSGPVSELYQSPERDILLVFRAEEGRRKSRLVGQGQQNREEHSDRAARLGGERKSNKSYLDALKNGSKNVEHLSIGDQPKVGRKDDQIYDQDSIIGEWRNEESNNNFLKTSVVGRVSSIDHVAAIKKLCAEIWLGSKEEDNSFSSFMEDQSLVLEELGINGSEENTSQSFGSKDDGIRETKWGEESQYVEDEDRLVNGGKRDDLTESGRKGRPEIWGTIRQQTENMNRQSAVIMI